MTVRELIDKNILKLVNQGENINCEIVGPYCCDLLSIAMGNIPAGAAWVTVMGNANTLAVAKLVDAACLILAQGAEFDEECQERAKQEGISVFYSDDPVFETALSVYKLC